MTRPLPNLRQNQSPNKNDAMVLKRDKRANNRSSSVPSVDGQKLYMNKLVEARLARQFQYFRTEFLDHAQNVGIPVPLDMVEAKNAKVMSFVNLKGPRYLLNIIHAHPESVHLLRSGLSFLIVIIAILTEKIKESSHRGKTDSSSGNVNTWAAEALNSIADSSSVAICTNLLRHSHSEAIQELILNLLAQLVSSSHEAAVQMMHRPYVSASPPNSSDPENRLESSTSKPSTPRERGGVPGDSNEMTCLSYMFSVVSHNRNRFTVMTACAEVCLALLKDECPEMCEAVARTRVCTQQLTVPEDSKKGSRQQYNDTAPSNPLRGSQNKGLLPPSAPHCRSTGNLDIGNDPSVPLSSRKNSPRRKLSNKYSTGNSNEWAAFKILLKFLHRFMRYGSTLNTELDCQKYSYRDIDDESLGNDSAVGNARMKNQGFEKPAKNDIVPHKHKKSLYNAHSRVLLVVCQLVTSSRAVANYLLGMPGACAILKASCDLHKEDDLSETVRNCLTMLQSETEVMYMKTMAMHHSVSYELTHGKSAKLFNPVSPISRRESALISPSRLRIESPGREGDHSAHPSRRNSALGLFAAETKRKGLQKHRAKSASKGPAIHRSNAIPPSELFCVKQKRYDSKIREDALEDYGDRQDDNYEGSSRWVSDIPDSAERTKVEIVSPNTSSFAQVNVKTNQPEVSVPSNQEYSFPQRPKSPVEQYNPPESPKRRGLGPHNGGSVALKDPNESLHRSLFTNLPQIPAMPTRLEAEDIINESNLYHNDDLLSRSMSLTASVVDQAYEEGFYRDGKNNIPISERARRVYHPEMPRIIGDSDRHPNFITEEYLEEMRNRPKSQGSVLGERSARLRAMGRKAAASARSKAGVGISSTASSTVESFDHDNPFSNYYQGLLPMNGVGEIENSTEFQLYLIDRINNGSQRVSTAPSALGQRSSVDSDGNLDSLSLDEQSSVRGNPSYASSLSGDGQLLFITDGSQCTDSVESWSGPKTGSQNFENTLKNTRLMHSLDMLFP